MRLGQGEGAAGVLAFILRASFIRLAFCLERRSPPYLASDGTFGWSAVSIFPHLGPGRIESDGGDDGDSDSDSDDGDRSTLLAPLRTPSGASAPPLGSPLLSFL